MAKILKSVRHRPYPIPDRPYVMQQAWYDLLFAHWTTDASPLRRMLPPGLELDLFDGRAYIAVVPFGMDDIRLRYLPPVPGTNRFLELNVRTYVRTGDRAGVYFFSLDAASRIAVRAARLWFGLPYYDARMSMNSRADLNGPSIAYESARTHSGAAPAALKVDYGPIGPEFRAVAGTLEHWLTERYCLYSVRNGQLLRGEIHHEPWPLQPAAARFHSNTMVEAAGLTAHDQTPLLHFASRLEVAAWAPTRVEVLNRVLSPAREAAG